MVDWKFVLVGFICVTVIVCVVALIWWLVLTNPVLALLIIYVPCLSLAGFGLAWLFQN